MRYIIIFLTILLIAPFAIAEPVITFTVINIETIKKVTTDTTIKEEILKKKDLLQEQINIISEIERYDAETKNIEKNRIDEKAKKLLRLQEIEEALKLMVL